MNLGPSGWSIAATAALLAAAAAAPLDAQRYDDCDHSRELSQTLSLGAAAEVAVTAGAGSLSVRGVRGLRDVRIRGTACASSASLLAELAVATRNDGSRAYVETVFPRDIDRETARIDLVVEIPEAMAATIEDGSGSMEISGLGSLTVGDGSGEVTIENILGDVDIADGSGTLTIRGVAGFVNVTDGSGAVTIDDVGGVRIHDGSGSIRVNGVRGDFTVTGDGSGSVNWSRVSGRVDVPSSKRDDWF